jgi:dienelactone hydrolase
MYHIGRIMTWPVLYCFVSVPHSSGWTAATICDNTKAMSRLLVTAFAACAFATCLGAQTRIPAEDARNTAIPNTDTHFVPYTYKTLPEWEAHKQALRTQILSAAGLLPMLPKNDLHPQIFGRVQNRDCFIEKVLIETLPGYYLAGNLYSPLKPAPAGGFPAVISPHGHWAYGRLENTDITSVPARAINLARQGYVVFSYDMVGYNDTIQTPHDFGDTPKEELWDFGPFGLQLWNSIRAIDFVEKLPDVNPRMIGATGASGGGTQTFTVAAVDDRIKFSAPANMVSLIMQGGGLCENAPGLRLDTNNVEIAAMMAPRPMIMSAATGDWTRNMATEEYPAVRAIYDLYDKAAEVEMFFQDAPHNYNKPNREATYAFFGKHVLGETDPSKLKERNIQMEKLQDMMVLHDRTLSANAINFAQLFDEWIRLAKDQTGDLRQRLTAALAAEWPAQVVSEKTGESGEHIVLGRPGKGDRIPAIWIPGSNPPALVIHPDGAETARQDPAVARLLQDGRAVLLIDAFQTGSAVAPRDRSVKMFLTFNKTDDANRVQDILTGLAWLNQPKTQLVGLGKSAVWCEFAAAVSTVPVNLQADLTGFHGTDEEFVQDFFVPGIQRAGGLSAARAVVH